MSEGASGGASRRPEPVPGLTNARTVSLERAPIRTRESDVTLSGWRLSVESDEGQGAIVLVEAAVGEPWYRGEGVFLGWNAEDLQTSYESLRPRPEEPAFEVGQLG